MFKYFTSICILCFTVVLAALNGYAAPNINGSDMPGALINRQRQAEIYDQKAPWINKAVTREDLNREDNIYYDEDYLDESEIYAEGNIIDNENEYAE